jgi:translation initiation factor 3 subunit H
MATSRSSRSVQPETASAVKYVQLDPLVMHKVIKHCHEEGAGVTDVAQGALLGLVVEERLEITNCFPFPRHSENDEIDDVEYQMEMMRHLRQVNVDHLHVGWYQSTYFGGFLSKTLLDSQFSYQNSIDESVVLIYDPLRTSRGFPAIRAYRLTPLAMQLYKDQDFSPESVRSSKVTFESMFEEIPVFVKNSHLTNALLCEISEMSPEQVDNQSLDLSTSSVLERTLRQLMESVDELSQETNKVTNHLRQVGKQQQSKHQYLQKRAQENASRSARGEAPLPDDDVNKLFKSIPPPTRLDAMLCAGQISNYCTQINQFATQSLGKLFVSEALQANKS